MSVEQFAPGMMIKFKHPDEVDDVGFVAFLKSGSRASLRQFWRVKSMWFSSMGVPHVLCEEWRFPGDLSAAEDHNFPASWMERAARSEILRMVPDDAAAVAAVRSKRRAVTIPMLDAHRKVVEEAIKKQVDRLEKMVDGMDKVRQSELRCIREDMTNMAVRIDLLENAVGGRLRTLDDRINKLATTEVNVPGLNRLDNRVARLERISGARHKLSGRPGHDQRLAALEAMLVPITAAIKKLGHDLVQVSADEFSRRGNPPLPLHHVTTGRMSSKSQPEHLFPRGTSVRLKQLDVIGDDDRLDVLVGPNCPFRAGQKFVVDLDYLWTNNERLVACIVADQEHMRATFPQAWLEACDA